MDSDRFRAQVDEQRHARTKASFRVAMQAGPRVHEIEETTREGYATYARLYLYPAFGDEPVGKISARFLELSGATIRRIHFVISATLAAAARWDWIKSNPRRSPRSRGTDASTRSAHGRAGGPYHRCGVGAGRDK